MNSTRRRIILGLVLVAIFAAIWYLQRGRSRPAPANNVIRRDSSGVYPLAPEISTPDGFINTDGIALADVVGKKVVLVDFWTYSCINCQRTTPYLNAWYETYRDQGLEIIGIHTPEFEFEKKIENVRRAVEQFGIKFPVVLDNDFSTWQSYGNRYWPRKYLIDLDGRIVYDHIGEGAYDETEQKIRELLAQRVELSVDMAKPDGAVTRMFASRSPEIYFGAARNERLGNGEPGVAGRQTLTMPAQMKDDTLYLSGEWDLREEYAQNLGEARVAFRYRAMNVYMVARSDEAVTVRVLRDGEPLPSALAGADVVNGELTVQGDRLYHLISEPAGSEHVLELVIEAPGLQAFTFTFG